MSRVPRARRLTPPAPVPPRSDLSSLALVRIARDNTLKTWPARAYEDLVVHRRLFGKNCYLVNDPVAVRHILSEDGAVYERPISVRRIIFPFARGGLVVAEGSERLRHRRTLAPAFTPHQVERLLPRFVEASTAMLGLLGNGGRANLAAILGRVTLDAAGRALFSVPLVDRAERMAQLLHDYFGRAARGTLWDALAQFLVANEIGSWQFGSARGALGRQWAAEVETIINERRTSRVVRRGDPGRARPPTRRARPGKRRAPPRRRGARPGFLDACRRLRYHGAGSVLDGLPAQPRPRRAGPGARGDRPLSTRGSEIAGRPRQMAEPRPRPPRSAQALSDHLGLRPPPSHARLRTRHRDGSGLAGHDQPVGDAPPPQDSGTSRMPSCPSVSRALREGISPMAPTFPSAAAVAPASAGPLR